MIVKARRRIRRWRIAAPYRLGLRTCRHPGYTVEYSWFRHHPDGRPESYDRCGRCRRVTRRSWEKWPFNQPRWRKVLIRARASWNLRGNRKQGTGD